MRLKKGLLLILFIAFTACASNNNSTPTGSEAVAQNSAAPPSSKNYTKTIQSASGEKCAIDEKRICEEGTQPILNDPYSKGDFNERYTSGEQNPNGQGRSATTRYTLSLLQGDRPIIIYCARNPIRGTITDGQLATSGTPTDTDIAKLRAAGYCS